MAFDREPDEKPVRVNIDGAVYKNLPKKQEPARHGFSQCRHLTDEDIMRMGRGHDVEKILAGFAETLYLNVAGAMVGRLVNAGPHVVDLQVRTYYDQLARAQVVTASTPLLETKTYGPSVSAAELARSVTPRAVVAIVEPQEKPPLWRRFVDWVNEGIVYDGPAGVDAA